MFSVDSDIRSSLLFICLDRVVIWSLNEPNVLVKFIDNPSIALQILCTFFISLTSFLEC